MRKLGGQIGDVYFHVLGWPKSLFEFFRKMVPKARMNFLANPILTHSLSALKSHLFLKSYKGYLSHFNVFKAMC